MWYACDGCTFAAEDGTSTCLLFNISCALCHETGVQTLVPLIPHVTEQVSGDLLREWSILLMGSPLAAAAGNGEEGYAYVFKAREGVEAPSDFEQRALSRSCTDIQEVRRRELLQEIHSQ